ncbi:30S ribosomal protein S17 [Candidatus Altiarchaeota archaeon]
MECKDVNCPIHGELATRGTVLEGEVVSDKMEKTVIVQREYFVKVKKYDRFKRARSRIAVHNPECVHANTGDRVRIMECRRLSKTVSFVVVEKLHSDQVEAEPEQAKPAKKPKAKAAKKTSTKKTVKKKTKEE